MFEMLLHRALLLLCCLGISMTESVLPNVTWNEEVSTLSATCDSNSSTRLTFVTSLSIRGCALFVHRLGEVKSGRFVLEPTFCITSSDSWRRPRAHFDQLTKESYFSFPVTVTNELLLSEAEMQLHSFAPKSVAFLQVTAVRLNYATSFMIKNASFEWESTENDGHLRVMCDRFKCHTMALYLSRGQAEVLESIRLVATLQFNEECAPITHTYPVTIAHYPLLLIKALQRPRNGHLRMCSDLHLFKVVKLGDCTAYVHQRQTKKGQFVIEPLLCPSANFSLLTDSSLRRHYLKLPATVEDSAVLDAVKFRLAAVSPQSVEFMRLWDASIHVSARLSQWQVQPLRLSTDRKSAELRVYCEDQTSCDLIGSVLNSEPVNFWRNIQWNTTSVLNEKCEFQSMKHHIALKMSERTSTAAMLKTGSRWNLEALRNRTVIRDDRIFLVVLQRGCRTSNFQRYWAEYVEGFGDNHNFWIGLGVLHNLTYPQGATMRVEMLLWNETEWFAEYSGFAVKSASAKYAMSYTGMNLAKSSLLHDALASSRNMPFSTRDVDNHVYSSTGYCSNSWGGHSGWWFQRCSNANPNGVYSFAESSSSANSVWYFNEGFKALKEFRMMLQI